MPPPSQPTTPPLWRTTQLRLPSFPSTLPQALTHMPLLAAPSLAASAGLPELYSNYKTSGENLSLFFFLFEKCWGWLDVQRTVFSVW